MPFWEETIAPALKSGKTVFVAAHGNSIRAILKFLEGISDNDITGRKFVLNALICSSSILKLYILMPIASMHPMSQGLEIPTGRPLMYKLDKDADFSVKRFKKNDQMIKLINSGHSAAVISMSLPCSSCRI